MRNVMTLLPPGFLEIRIACLQNLTLATLKLARVSGRPVAFAEVVSLADSALEMNGRSVKALLRRGTALMELREFHSAVQSLTKAAQETRWNDPEVLRVLKEAKHLDGFKENDDDEEEDSDDEWSDYADYAEYG